MEEKQSVKKNIEIKFSPSALAFISAKLQAHKANQQKLQTPPTTSPVTCESKESISTVVNEVKEKKKEDSSEEGDIEIVDVKEDMDKDVEIIEIDKKEISSNNLPTNIVNKNSSPANDFNKCVEMLQRFLQAENINFQIADILPLTKLNPNDFEKTINSNQTLKTLLSNSLYSLIGKPDLTGSIGDFLLIFLNDLTLIDFFHFQRGDYTPFNKLLTPLHSQLEKLLDNSISVDSIQQLSESIVQAIGSDLHEDLLPPQILSKIKPNQNLTKSSLSVLSTFIPSLFQLISSHFNNNSNNNNNNSNNSNNNNSNDNNSNNNNSSNNNNNNNNQNNNINVVITVDFAASIRDWTRDFLDALISSMASVLKGGEVDALAVVQFFLQQRISLFCPQLEFLSSIFLTTLQLPTAKRKRVSST